VPLNPKTLKITHLFAQFLYTNKQLDLPGIGTFLLDPSVVIDIDKNKQQKPVDLNGVTFKYDTSIKEDPRLIAFISEHTGKIKALASADLYSHLELAKQFLNIGKPYLFEGIGSLSKMQTGELSFTPGYVLAERMETIATKDHQKETITEEPAGDYSSVLYNKKDKTAWKKPAALALIIAGFGLAIWGGYTVYKNNAAKKENPVIEQTPVDEVVTKVKDTSVTIKDTAVNIQPVSATPAGSVKFILETSPKERAFFRFNRLRTFQWKVDMETKDSSLFTIYMLLPVNASDTSRVLDSLSRLNGKRVYIQQ
jgi:hypothetical protein